MSLPVAPLAGRTAIVTGGTRSIGRAISLHLASLGANLVLNYVANSAQADLTALEINSNPSLSPSRAIAVKADVSDPKAVKLLFDRTEEEFGSPAHIVVHNAAILDTNYPAISSTPVEEFDKIFQVNMRGSFLVCREAARRVARGGSGRIVAISSSLVGFWSPGFGAFTASKAAMEAMMRTLAKELKATGITANCVAPGPIESKKLFEGFSEEMVRRFVDMTPMGRLGETKDVAPVVGFLCREEGEWINGQVIRVNGGFV